MANIQGEQKCVIYHFGNWTVQLPGKVHHSEIKVYWLGILTFRIAACSTVNSELTFSLLILCVMWRKICCENNLNQLKVSS
jgi:hypothetical protein